MIAAGAALVLAGAVVAFAAVKSNTVRVAFYGVDQGVGDCVKGEIANMNFRRVRYYELDASEPLPAGFEKKYSILIAKNCLSVKRNSQKFIPLGDGLLEALPISIRKPTELGERHYALSLLLDHFEISYFQPAQKKLGLSKPQSYGALLRYLEAVKGSCEIPLVCAGAQDKDLLGFASVMSEIFYGAEGYKKMLEAVAQSVALNKNSLPESLTRVLDEIKAMQASGLLFEKWTKTTQKDVRFFMQNQSVAAAAMFLSDRRGYDYNLIKYFDASYFPRYERLSEHGLVAPQIVAALLSGKNGAPLILGQLVSNQAQENLTNTSLLAPTASRAESVDRQADDVRFWAASCPGGPLGSMEEECALSAERSRSLAQKIRVYLEK